MRLGDATWPEAAGLGRATLVVPLGATEQHGPHLPLDTDTRIAVALAEAAAVDAREVVVGPPVAYGASGEHEAFAGTVSIGTEALTMLLVELARSALPPFGRLLFVNGHGGNADAVARATRVAAGEGRAVASWAPRVHGGDAHAGHVETSLLLAISPEAVRLDLLAPGNTTPLAELATELRAGGVAPVAPSGVLGDPTTASAAAGRRLFDNLVAELGAVLHGTVGTEAG
jgi:mycofactocin precursor peptide peptidase